MQILPLKITVKKIYHLISSTVLFAYQFNLLQFSWQVEMHTQRLNKKIGPFFFIIKSQTSIKIRVELLAAAIFFVLLLAATG